MTGKHRKGKIVLTILLSILAILAIGIFALLKVSVLKTFPKWKGEPETGKWYEVPIDEAKSSDGSEWHGIFKKGTENKVVVFFFENYKILIAEMNTFPPRSNCAQTVAGATCHHGRSR